MTTITSRVFMNGNSQAIRIPKAFRLNANQVQIFKNESGDLVIRSHNPSRHQRGDALMSAFQQFDSDFVAALEAQRTDQDPMQDREPL